MDFNIPYQRKCKECREFKVSALLISCPDTYTYSRKIIHVKITNILPVAQIYKNTLNCYSTEEKKYWKTLCKYIFKKKCKFWISNNISEEKNIMKRAVVPPTCMESRWDIFIQVNMEALSSGTTMCSTKLT